MEVIKVFKHNIIFNFMFIKNINFTNIKSLLLDSFIDNDNDNQDYLDLNIDLNISEIELDNFNNRIINPENINTIIKICDFFLIENTEEFIILNSTPTKKIYQLNEYNSGHYNLPNFMTGNITCDETVKYGLINWLNFAFENNYTYDDNVINTAAIYGRLDCLKYLHNKGFDLNIELCKFAVRNGHFDCVQYLISNNCEVDEWTCTYGVYLNHINCIKLLHENGCPWNEDLCALSASYNRLEILKYAHEN